MTHPNLELINQFFQAYGARDLPALRRVLAEDVRWVFPGRHPLAGAKIGVDEVVAFFDAMGGVMSNAKVKVEALVSGVSDTHVAEAQHMTTHREGEDVLNLEQYWCVLWTFADGRIKEGRHLASDQQAVDEFFNHPLD
jgi:ketosteroid isomerase-like protein